MKHLHEMCLKAKSIATHDGEAEYQTFASGLVSEIRAAAERIVEEVLFNNVLREHDSQVKMGHLEAVGDVEYEDYQAVYAVWRECSRLIPGHASPAILHVTIPPHGASAAL